LQGRVCGATALCVACSSKNVGGGGEGGGVHSLQGEL
jgi:hypothetical protein